MSTTHKIWEVILEVDCEGQLEIGVRYKSHWARWLKPVIPALWEAKAGGSRVQQIETIPVNMVKPRLY